MSDSNPRWGGVAHSRQYGNAEKSASPPASYDVGSCGIVQNEVRTSGEKWHKSDTGGSASVPAGVAAAGDWYRSNRDACPHPVIPALCEQFGLSALQAVAAIRLANAPVQP